MTLAFAAAAPCRFMSYRQGVRTPASQSKFPQKGTFHIKLVSPMQPRLVFHKARAVPSAKAVKPETP
jgi:hypothetical protein